MNISGLLERVKFGEGLKSNEIVAVYNRLVETNSDSERYTALHILGLTKSTQYRNAVEVFLMWPEDPMVSAMALKVLCRYWGLMGEYIDQVMSFLKGVSWDYTDDCRLAATDVCGDYLQAHTHKQLLIELLCLFEDKSVNPIVRESAYIAMGRALGIASKDLPSASGKMEERKRIDPAIIQKITDIITDRGS